MTRIPLDQRPGPSSHIFRGDQIPIARAEPLNSSSRGFLPWRFSDAGPRSPPPRQSLGRHPKTFTEGDIRRKIVGQNPAGWAKATLNIKSYFGSVILSLGLGAIAFAPID
jgi:hypothetical protein